MPDRPAVSINLCCYNSERFLEETLASVFAQTFQDYELVVIDDGSKDRTDSVIRSYLTAHGRRITYHPQPNAGLGAARNKALELSRGDLIAILDHDDVWEPAKLARQLELFKKPEVGFAACDVMMIDTAGRSLYRYGDRNPMRRGRILRDLTLYNFIPCAATVMRRSAIEAAGGFFRPDFRIAEEYELFLRLAERFEFDFIPEPLVRIRVHANSAGWDTVQERAELRRTYRELFERNPDLARDLGPRATSIKQAGFWLRPETAEALAGRPAPSGRAVPVREKLRGAFLLELSQLPTFLGDLLLRCKRFLARMTLV